MQLLIMQSYPASRYLLPVWSKYSPQHPIQNILNLVSSLDLRHRVSDRYKTRENDTSVF